MTAALALQIFLYINIFIMGVLVVIAVQHALAHFKPHKEEPHPHQPDAQLPQAVKRRLLRKAEDNYQTILDRSAAELQHSLQATSLQLTKQLNTFGETIIRDEMDRYKASLEQLRTQAEQTIGGAQNDINEHQAALKAKLDARQQELETKLAEQYATREAEMNEQISAEQQQLLRQIDTKLADAVASFLMETMQHQVDLGAQSTYLTAMLEEHKSELAKKVSNEA